MDFWRNIFSYFRGNNTRRDDENKFSPALENNIQNTAEWIPRDEVDVELPQDFISRTYGGNESYDDNMSGFWLRNNAPFFGDFSSLFQIINHFEEAMNEVERHFNGSMDFHNFPEPDFEHVRDGIFRESEKTLTGERLRNYYLNVNNPDTYQGENQIIALDDQESVDQSNLIIDNRKLSDFTTTPYFKSQSRHVTTKIGPDGVAEITTILKDESGNEERTVRKVKLF